MLDNAHDQYDITTVMTMTINTTTSLQITVHDMWPIIIRYHRIAASQRNETVQICTSVSEVWHSTIVTACDRQTDRRTGSCNCYYA